ncbi:MAG: DUF3108 domain-containing protein [Bacteroidia bacterium]
MKRLLLYAAIIGSLPVLAGGGKTAVDMRKLNNSSFKRGEVLKYRVHYGAINAGEAIISIDESNKQIGGRNTLHAVGKGYSLGAFDWFFKVRDSYESYIDEEALVPWLFIRRVDEGGFKINQNQIYDHEAGRVNSDGKMMNVPKYVQDMLSAFFYARTFDFSKAKVGDIYTVPTFVDNEVWELKMKYIGSETIKSDLGKLNCIKFRPVVQKGRVFKKEEDLTVWISNDVNHIPVRAEAEILVGSVKLDLMSVKGTMKPLNIVK